MFNDVQKKLTILYSTMTGLILMILLACIFLWNITSREQGESVAFQNLWLAVQSRIQTDSILPNSYLAQTEADNRAIIYLEENGFPFLYSGSWTPDSPRNQLIELGIAEAAKENIFPSQPPISSSLNQTSAFVVKGEHGDSYYGKMSVLATKNGSKTLLILSYITPRTVFIQKSLPLFLLLNAVGIVCIFFVSWFFTGRALRPAREGVKKQADFIAAASHELRSPLAVIRSSVSALKLKYNDTAASSGHISDSTNGQNSAPTSGQNSAPTSSQTSAPTSSQISAPTSGQASAPTGGQASAPSSGQTSGEMARPEYDTAQLLFGIDKECSRMARLVSDMLLLAASDAKNWTLQKQEVETDTLLIETYESFLPLCREKHIALSLSLPESSLPPLAADKQRLEQILAILLDNAISHTPTGKEILLKAYVPQDTPSLSSGKSHITFEIQDQGVGIPDAIKKRIFDRFYRGDVSRNDKKHFGLGLSIAKELTELHGGTIAVLDNPGGGCRFIVQL